MPYGFTSPGANALSAIEQFLVQREQENRQRMLDDLMRQQQETNNAARDREFDLRDRQEQRVTEDRERERSEAANAKGMRQFTAEALRTPGILDDRGKMQALGADVYQETGQIPGILAPAFQPEKPDTRAADLADYEARKMIDASVRPQEPTERYRTVGGAIFDTETRGFMTPPEQGGTRSGGGATNSTSGAGQPSAYAMETATRTIQAIDDVLPKINNMTAGGGSLLKMVPGSEAANVSAELSSVAANVAFNALQAMREASKTGGALGQVSERELDLLSAVSGSIRQNQSPENLKIQLGKIRESMARFQSAAQGGGGAGGNRQRWGRDAQGNPVRMQ